MTTNNQKATHPFGLILCLNLPHLIFLLLMLSAYPLVRSLPTVADSHNWAWFLGIFAVFELSVLAYAFWLYRAGKKVGVFEALGILILSVLAIVLFLNNMAELIPRSVPRWILVPDDYVHYLFSLAMPGIFYALFLLIMTMTPDPEERKGLLEFGLALLVPGLCYIVLRFFNSLIYYIERIPVTGGYILGTLAVLATTMFLFLVGRFCYIRFHRGKSGSVVRLILLFLFTTLFPVIGLILSVHTSGNTGSDFIGTFKHPGFFIFAVLNGLSLFVPELKPKLLPRTAVFWLRLLFFPYTLYFFFAFLPFLPLSLLAIIVFGVGFLMLTPIVLFPLHVHFLWRDRSILGGNYRMFKRVVAVLALLVLPGMVTCDNLLDRQVLHQALDIVFTPNYQNDEKRELNMERLESILSKVTRQNRRWSPKSTPLLSAWFRWVVLDNLTLSNSKMRAFKQAFQLLDDYETPVAMGPLRDIEEIQDVKLENLVASSQYDSVNGVWRSRVDLVLRNSSIYQREYTVQFQLPTGAYISDYYLDIEGERVPGMLMEKKSALWVYAQIVNRRRDPGVLFYRGDELMELRVFPFEGHQQRKTGFELIHPNPLTLKLDGQYQPLGLEDRQPTTPVVSSDGRVHFITASMKQFLPIQAREQYMHLIVDCSKSTAEQQEKYVEEIEKLSQATQGAKLKKITFANYRSRTISGEENWKEAYGEFPKEGGFLLEKTMRRILVQHYLSGTDDYPVIVVLTPNLKTALVTKRLSNLEFTYPESSSFYRLDESGQFWSYSLTDYPDGEGKLTSEFPVSRTRLYRNKAGEKVFLPDDGKASVAWFRNGNMVKKEEKNQYASALTQTGMWRELALNPAGDNKWRASVAESQRDRVLSPYTSFIVVENELQREALRKKQEEILKGKRGLDLSGDDPVGMDEPGWLTMLAAMLLLFFANHWWERRKRKTPGSITELGGDEKG